MDLDEKNKRVQNLFRSLQNDPKSVFYTTNKIIKSLLKKAKMGTYNKDDVFVKLYEQLEDKIFYKNENLPFVTLYIIKNLILTIQHFIVLVELLKHYMLILLIWDF